MKLEEMVETLSKSTTRIIPKNVLEGMILYYGSVLMGNYGYKKDLAYKKSMIRMYVLMILNSGGGKSFVMDYVRSIMIEEESYLKLQTAMFALYKEKLGIKKDEHDRFAPYSVSMDIDGTTSGVKNYALYIGKTNCFSFNLHTNEYFLAMKSNNEIIDKLIDMYDGDINPSMLTGSSEDSFSDKVAIKGLSVNVLSVGSDDSLEKTIKKKFVDNYRGGLFRRTFIIKNSSLPTNNKGRITSTNKIKAHFKNMNERERVKFINFIGNNNKISNKRAFPLSDGFRKMAKEIDFMLIDNAHKDKLNKFTAYDTGAGEMIFDMAIIIAFIEGKKIATEVELMKAKEIFCKSRNDIKDIFVQSSAHISLYEILEMANSPLAHSEILEVDTSESIPHQKKAFEETVLLASEKAYKALKNLEITTISGVTRYKLKKLNQTNIDNLNISIIPFQNTKDKYNEPKIFASNFKLSFLTDIALSDKIDGFSFSDYINYSKNPTISNIDESKAVSVFAFSFDEEQKDDILSKLSVYNKAVYVDDKNLYTIFLPTDTEFFIHSINYNTFTNKLLLSLDIQPINVYSKLKSTIYRNFVKEELLDYNKGNNINVSCCMPGIDNYDDDDDNYDDDDDDYIV